MDLGKMWVHYPDDRIYVSIYSTPVMHCLSVCLSVWRSVIGACKHVFKEENVTISLTVICSHYSSVCSSLKICIDSVPENTTSSFFHLEEWMHMRGACFQCDCLDCWWVSGVLLPPWLKKKKKKKKEKKKYGWSDPNPRRLWILGEWIFLQS